MIFPHVHASISGFKMHRHNPVRRKTIVPGKRSRRFRSCMTSARGSVAFMARSAHEFYEYPIHSIEFAECALYFSPSRQQMNASKILLTECSGGNFDGSNAAWLIASPGWDTLRARVWGFAINLPPGVRKQFWELHGKRRHFSARFQRYPASCRFMNCATNKCAFSESPFPLFSNCDDHPRSHRLWRAYEWQSSPAIRIFCTVNLYPTESNFDRSLIHLLWNDFYDLYFTFTV